MKLKNISCGEEALLTVCVWTPVTMVTNNLSWSQTVEEGGCQYATVCDACLCVCVFDIRMYRRTSTMAGLTYPPTALTALKVKTDHRRK